MPAQPQVPAAAPVEAPARRLTDASESPGTVIGAATTIRGDVTGDDAVDLAGVLEGGARVSALVRVRPGARVNGDITASSIVVEGDVSARMLVATDRIEVGATARVRGNLRARVVALAEGAFFDGQVHMHGREGPAGPTIFKEKRKGRRGR